MNGGTTVVDITSARGASTGSPRATKHWRRASVGLFKSLVDYRLTLRSTARRAGDQVTAQRLRRLARRNRATTTMLKRLEPALDPNTLDIELDPRSGDPLWLSGSGEIGAIGACLRRNRRVRSFASKIASGGAPSRMKRFAARPPRSGRTRGVGAQLDGSVSVRRTRRNDRRRSTEVGHGRVELRARTHRPGSLRSDLLVYPKSSSWSERAVSREKAAAAAVERPRHTSPQLRVGAPPGRCYRTTPVRYASSR